MAAAVSASAVEATTAMIATSAVESSVAMKAASSIAAVIAATDVAVSTSVSVAGPITIPSTIEGGVAIVAMAPIAVIPGAGADEDAANEVVRAIVAVGSAGVRIITVVAISADRCWSNGDADRTYSNANSDLGVRASRSEEQNCKECKIF